MRKIHRSFHAPLAFQVPTEGKEGKILVGLAKGASTYVHIDRGLMLCEPTTKVHQQLARPSTNVSSILSFESVSQSGWMDGWMDGACG